MTKWLKISVLLVAVVITALFCPPVAKVRAIPVSEIRANLQKPKYNQFEHKTQAHRQECANCHKFPSANWNKVRTGPDAFADITEYPQHESCTKCHKQQFFKGTPPTICSICHTTPGPRISTRHPFPNPREIFDLSPKGKKATSDFAVGFPHDKHIEIVSSHGWGKVGFINASFSRETRLAEESCAVCHKTMSPQGDLADEYLVKKPDKIGEAFWLKRGTFKSTPIGHATCFTCHSADSGMLPAPENCAGCHKLKSPQPAADLNEKLASAMGVNEKVMLDRWRMRDSSGTFRHEWFSHAELSCSTCHNVMTMNTADPLTKKVSMAACATCHATATLDDGGALNFEADSRQRNPKFDCTKCHITFGKLAIPKSHLEALGAAAGK
ncbi:MAG: cytochrome c3 family protein [Pyrinomonadaceae bacterium]